MSYERVGKYALIAHQRYAHAKQFKRANRALMTLRTYLGRTARDIVRKIKGDAALRSVFAEPPSLAWRVRDQRGRKLYSLCTRTRSKASARARRIGHTNSASRSRWRRRSIAPKAANSSPM